MLIMRKCADYVINILTGHGDFGDKDIHVVHQANVLCCVCTEEFIVKTTGILKRQCFPLV